MPVLKIPEGLTIRVTTNARENTTKILAYRKGGFKRAYKAVLPMCDFSWCRLKGTHAGFRYHQDDVDKFIRALIKSYR